MRIFDAHFGLLAKAMPIILSAWLCSSIAVALDGPPSVSSDSAKRDPVVSPLDAPAPVSSVEDSEHTEDTSVLDVPIQTKPGMESRVLEVAGAPLKAIGSVVDSTRDAIRSYLAGDKQEAIKTLSDAADKGHAPAQWKLARMYAEGDGVPRDDVRAFENFSLMCDRHAEESPESPTAPFVSSAFVALGSYYLKGIPNSQIKANPVRAREMFAYSASYFGDAEAQFILARLFLDGVGGAKDPKQALRWLNLSAEKGHHLAQAQLGQLLFSGEAGPKQRARGLMWLTLASDEADPSNEVWIIEAHRVAFEQASDTDRLAANAYLMQHNRIQK